MNKKYPHKMLFNLILNNGNLLALKRSKLSSKSLVEHDSRHHPDDVVSTIALGDRQFESFPHLDLDWSNQFGSFYWHAPMYSSQLWNNHVQLHWQQIKNAIDSLIYCSFWKNYSNKWTYRCWQQTLFRSECGRANSSFQTVTNWANVPMLVRHHNSAFSIILLPLPV